MPAAPGKSGLAAVLVARFALIVMAAAVAATVTFAPAVIVAPFPFGASIVRMVFLPPVVIPVPLVMPVLRVTPFDDVPVSVLDQSRRKVAGLDVVPGAIVVGSSVPYATLGGVVIVVDIEETERNPDCRIETKLLRVEKQRRFCHDKRRRGRVAKANVYVGTDPDIT
jgi:hypothetical protein